MMNSCIANLSERGREFFIFEYREKAKSQWTILNYLKHAYQPEVCPIVWDSLLRVFTSLCDKDLYSHRMVLKSANLPFRLYAYVSTKSPLRVERRFYAQKTGKGKKAF
jgi:hypothetical protein